MTEILVLLTALLLGYPAPLAAVQILWLSLVIEPAEGDEMRRRPISPITREVLGRRAVMTPVIATCTFGWFAVGLLGEFRPWSLDRNVPAVRGVQVRDLQGVHHGVQEDPVPR